MADLTFCSRYPFSKPAKEYVSQSGIELTSSLVEKAEGRVREALVSGRIRKAAELPSAQEEELAVYAGARMVVSAAANRYLINRYAVAEAKRASDYLASDDSAHPDYVSEVAGEFGISFGTAGKNFLVPLAHYLACTPRSFDYKLTKRDVKGGMVRVSRHERIRILEEAVRKRIEGSLPIKAEFPAEVKSAAARISALIPKLEAAIVKVGQENYPPCIKKLIDDLALNVNVPHTGRVALAIYLVSAGVATEKIVELFRHAPDFSEKTTRYQVEYIRQKKYTMPSCSTMDSYGICIADCRCGTPLRYRDGIHGARLRRLEGEKKQ
jgi:DNA primase large subunit